MATVDMTPWRFADVHGDVVVMDQRSNLCSSLATLVARIAEDVDGRPAFQRTIRGWLRDDPIATSWHKSRQFLKELRHYPRYKHRDYDAYHHAARAVASKRASEKEEKLFEGLRLEIENSPLLLPPGQTLFHGRANRELSTSLPYPSFVSTTLDPVVAVVSALRRGGIGQVNGRPIVYVITLTTSLRAIWGNGGTPKEWELLLPPCLDFKSDQEISLSEFDIVCATTGAW